MVNFQIGWKFNSQTNERKLSLNNVDSSVLQVIKSINLKDTDVLINFKWSPEDFPLLEARKISYEVNIQ